MADKYKSYLHYLLAKIYRGFIRHRLAKLISWTPYPLPLESGCTAIIGLCSKLPHILAANLTCLSSSQWEVLREVFIVVDAEKGSLPSGFEEQIQSKFADLKISFFYYNQNQAYLTEKVKLPFAYSWLSWCIGLDHVRTDTALIHDYDALVFDDSLAKRYQIFRKSAAKIQGVAWYKSNGILAEDRLATTFEAFVEVRWLKSFAPIQLFNRVGVLNKRWVDYDTLLDIQANYTPSEQRTIVPMSREELVHPSQMIHQYTMFRKFPGKALPCQSTIMIPFFHFLGGQKMALSQAIQALQQGNFNNVDLLNDGTKINLTLLEVESVDFILKLILRTSIKLRISPFRELIDYGTILYHACKAPRDRIWVNNFTQEQRHWIEIAKSLP